MSEELLDQLEQARCGSRELSDEVLLACGWNNARDSSGSWWYPPNDSTYGLSSERPDPTRDLGDAMELLPKKHHGLSFVQWGEDMPWQVEWKAGGIDVIEGETLALAVSALAVVLSHQNEGEEVG